MKNPWVIIGIITVLLFGGAIWYSGVSTEKNNEGVVINDNLKGNQEASVVLVEYSDFQCPACASFQPVLKQIMDTYGDRIRFEYKHFPLPIHNYAQQAAMAAEAAGQQGKFFEYHDALFENQQTWSSSATPNVLFMQYATELGLDTDKFRQHMNATLLRDKIQADMREGRELGINGTPTFFLNGQRMQIETFEDFITQVAAAVDPNAVPVGASAGGGEGVRFGL
jgi:protein-disulfide isomerase